MAHHTPRVVHLDGRPPLPKNMKLWMGDSRGRWEDNTLVIDVTNQNDQTWLVIVGDSKTVIGGAPELFGPLFEHAKEEGLVAGVGAVVTACQRVGIRSQVQRLSRPHRGDRRTRRRRRGQRMPGEVAVNGEAAVTPNGSEPLIDVVEGAPTLNGNGSAEPQPTAAEPPVESHTESPAEPAG